MFKKKKILLFYGYLLVFVLEYVIHLFIITIIYETSAKHSKTRADQSKHVKKIGTKIRKQKVNTYLHFILNKNA